MAHHRITLELKNRHEEINRLKQEAINLGKIAGLFEKELFQLTLILEELFVNIVSYGYSDEGLHVIKVVMALEKDMMVITIQDDAEPFNPLDAEEPDLTCPVERSRVGGLGVHLVRRFCDEVTYERLEGFNRVTIKKAFSTPENENA